VITDSLKKEKYKLLSNIGQILFCDLPKRAHGDNFRDIHGKIMIYRQANQAKQEAQPDQ